MERQLQETLHLFQIINEKFNGNSDSLWYSDLQANVRGFHSIENDFNNFLEQAKDMNIEKNKRDILWTLVFGYRDFITELGYFAEIAKTISKTLKESTDLDSNQ